MKEADAQLKSSFTGVIVISAAVIAAMCGVAWWGWMQIDPGAKVPTHWGADGKADGFGSRNTLFLMPGIVGGLTLMFAFIPFIEPRRGHLLRSSGAYKAVWLGTVGFFALFHLAIVLVSLGHPISIDRAAYGLMGILFLVIGRAMGRVESNFFVGVRTPWTLSSELSWKKTHRVAGWLFAGWGILMLAGALAGATGPLMLGTVLGGALVVIVVALVYSYVVWKGDPDREAKG